MVLHLAASLAPPSVNPYRAILNASSLLSGEMEAVLFIEEHSIPEVPSFFQTGFAWSICCIISLQKVPKLHMFHIYILFTIIGNTVS